MEIDTHLSPDAYWTRLRFTRKAVGSLLMLLAVAQVFAFYPGYLSHDSAYQWWQARTGNISTLWPPGMIVLLAAVERLSESSGPTVLYVLHSATYWFSAIVFATCMQSRRGVVLVAALFAVCPAAWICLPHVWTDVELMALLMLVVALQVIATRTSKRLALAALAFTFLILAYAAIVRHNAVFALLPLCACSVWLRERLNAPQVSTRRNWPRVAAFTTLIMVGIALFQQAVLRWVPTSRSDTWAITLIWDLQALSVATHQVLVPRSISPDATVDDLIASYNPLNAVTLYVLSKRTWANSTIGLTSTQKSDLTDAWLAAVKAHPRDYLRHRLLVFRKMIGPKRDEARDGGANEPLRVAFRDNPVFAFNHPWALTAAQHWVTFIKPYWLGSGAVWIALSSLAAAAALRWRRGTSPELATSASGAAFVDMPELALCHTRLVQGIALATLLSGISYLLPLFFISPTADLRYALWPTLACLMAAALAWHECWPWHVRPNRKGLRRNYFGVAPFAAIRARNVSNAS